MKNNVFKRWCAIGLVAVMSGIFMFQNNIMTMKKTAMIELQSNNVVAQADSEFPDWVNAALLIFEGLLTADQIAAKFDQEGWTYCVCHKSNPNSPCMQGHRISLRHKCYNGETAQMANGGCSNADLQKVCIDYFNRNN